MCNVCLLSRFQKAHEPDCVLETVQRGGDLRAVHPGWLPLLLLCPAQLLAFASPNFWQLTSKALQGAHGQQGVLCICTSAPKTQPLAFAGVNPFLW